jgi:predicted nucleic acid-binding protein
VICVDASLVGAWLLPEDLSSLALLLRSRLRAAGEQFIAPALLWPEVTSALRKAIHGRRVEAEYGDEAFQAFKSFPIDLHEITGLADSAWAWGRTLHAPRLYDLYYLALADREDCDLWTADRRFVRLVGNRSHRIHWVGDLEDNHDQPA